MTTPGKLRLANLPTPLWHNPALDRLVGTEVWVKRDDMTAGAEAGNKIRKLEYLLHEAAARESTVVLTCGGFQSNHARATALLSRGLGMRSVLFLRATETEPAAVDRGNAFLDALGGAEIRIVNAAQYRERDELMEEASRDLRAAGERPYVIPEGGSNGRGALGYVEAMAEVRQQLDGGEAGEVERFDAVVHACGSGGTAAGIALGAARFGVGGQVFSMAVCDDEKYFLEVIGRVVAEARGLDGRLGEPGPLRVFDRWKGPAYGVPSPAQVDFIVAVARASGLILDPVYTGKALYGLAQMESKPARILFIHTGGLPGLLAQTDKFAATVDG
jgi:D-cysteine desulfhydrase